MYLVAYLIQTRVGPKKVQFRQDYMYLVAYLIQTRVSPRLLFGLDRLQGTCVVLFKLNLTRTDSCLD
jgi:hypothetical protein